MLDRPVKVVAEANHYKERHMDVGLRMGASQTIAWILHYRTHAFEASVSRR